MLFRSTLTITIELDRMVLAREKKKILRTNDVIDVLSSLGYNVELTLESATISNFRYPNKGTWKFKLKNKSNNLKKKSKKMLDVALSEKEETKFESGTN